MSRQGIMAVVFILCLPAAALCGEADVEGVEVESAGRGIFHFAVTVRHDDTGWDHYADRWEVVTPDGVVVGSRILHHPHVDEQPFTRSLSGVSISPAVNEVTIRAHDSVHEYGGKTVTVALPR